MCIYVVDNDVTLIFKVSMNCGMEVCVRNDRGGTLCQSDSFLTHAFCMRFLMLSLYCHLDSGHMYVGNSPNHLGHGSWRQLCALCRQSIVLSTLDSNYVN